MTKDRIKDLQKTTSWPRVSYQKLSRQYRNNDVQVFTTDTPSQLTTTDLERRSTDDPDDRLTKHRVAEFLAQIDLIQILIDKIKELTKDVETIHKKMLEPMADSKLNQELDDKTADVKRLAYDISTKLKRLEQMQENQDHKDRFSAQWRIQEAQIYTMTRRFQDIMNAYNLEFVSHRERCKKAIIRQCEIAGQRKTNEEIEVMLEDGFRGLLTSSIMVDVEQVRQAVTAIEARHDDIKKLEASIRELHEMFTDLARLVTIQGEMIDNIEFNISKAQDFVGQAAGQIDQARDSQERRRRRIICIIITIITIVFVLLIILALYLLIQKKILGI